MARKDAKTWETEKYPFPSRLSKIMKERQVSQEKLANALGVKRQTVSLYKTGQSSPNAEQLCKIAKFFNISSDWLLGISEAKSPDSDIQQICKQTGLSEDIVKYLQLSSKSGPRVLPSISNFNIFFRESGRELFGFIDDLAWYNEYAESAQKTGNDIKQAFEELKDAGCLPLNALDEFIEELAPVMKEIQYRRFVCIDHLTKRFDMAFKCDAIETLLQETFDSISDAEAEESWMCNYN